MVTVTELRDSFEIQESLREERRRTGRYVATVIAIFVSLFGLYQALSRGTPEYAAFFLPALIMFFYVLWILYASRSRESSSHKKKLDENGGTINIPPIDLSSFKPIPLDTSRTIPRSYSIA